MNRHDKLIEQFSSTMISDVLVGGKSFLALFFGRSAVDSGALCTQNFCELFSLIGRGFGRGWYNHPADFNLGVLLSKARDYYPIRN